MRGAEFCCISPKHWYGLILSVSQHALRLLAFGQLYKVLNMDPLPANKPSARLLEGVCFHINVHIACMLIRLCSCTSVSMYQCFVSLPHLVLGHLHSEYTLVIICLANLVAVLVSLCGVSGDQSVCAPQVAVRRGFGRTRGQTTETSSKGWKVTLTIDSLVSVVT